MQIGIPTETVVGENRVAATPETVKKLISAGHNVVIEGGAGVKAAYIDSAYEQVGAKITDDAYAGSQIVLKVRAPKGEEIQKLAPNTAVIAMFDPYRNPELDQGVGVAGLQAIATAKRLGAVVEATDLRPTARDQVESLGGKWLDVPMSDEEKQKAADAAKNGYGWMPGEQYIKDQAIIVDKAVSNADIVITTALLPGRDAPRLIKAETVAKMKPGSVILDMAVETGGNVEGSKCGETVMTGNGVKILGIPNIPSTVSTEASALYARNILNFLDTLFDAEKNFALNPEEEIQKALLVTHGGQVLLKRG